MMPLLWAFPMGEKIFRRLLEHGADPNVKLTERIYPFYTGDSVMFSQPVPARLMPVFFTVSHACLFHPVLCLYLSRRVMPVFFTTSRWTTP